MTAMMAPRGDGCKDSYRTIPAISRSRGRDRLTVCVCRTNRSGSPLTVATVARRSSARTPFLVVAGALFILLLDGNLPTPLYAVYRERFGFSGTELTLIFAIYAMALIPSLLVFGQLSDRVGRRPVIAGGLCVAAVGLLLLALAQSTVWLLVARAVQGLALGTTVGTAAAALVELEPDGDPGRAALAAVLGQSGGSAAGPLVAGVLAQWAPAPRQLCYLVGIALTIAAVLAVVRIEEPGEPSGEWRLQTPSVPGEARAAFARASLTGASVWAVGALFLSVVPSYAAKLLVTGNLALLGAISAIMLAMACLAQALSVRGAMTPGRAQPAGLGLLVAGIGALVLAFPAHSLALVLVAAVLAGTGLGLGYFGSQAQVNALAPSDRRGEVTAAFITCLYSGVTVTVITTGALADAISLYTAVAAVGIAVAAVAATTAVWHLAAHDE
jgi:MFS family permease